MIIILCAAENNSNHLPIDVAQRMQKGTLRNFFV